MRSSGRVGLLLALCGVLTIVLQSWVGASTIYHEGAEPMQLKLHTAILHNELPPDAVSWRNLGANGTNIRVFPVYLAEAVHRLFDTSLPRAYRQLDSVALFLSFVLVFAYLRQWFDEKYALIGMLYVAAVMPLTYYFFYFHPWDRIGMVFWMSILLLIRRERAVLLGLTLIVAMTNKTDVMFLPALYGAYTFGRVSWLRWGLTTGGLSIATLGTYLVLLQVFTDGLSSEPMTQLIPRMVAYNWKVFLELGITHPPLLAFLLPMALAIPGLFSRERLVWASAGFSFALLGIHVLLVNLHEVRAQVPLIALLLPAALFNLRALLERPSVEPTSAA